MGWTLNVNLQLQKRTENTAGQGQAAKVNVYEEQAIIFEPRADVGPHLVIFLFKHTIIKSNCIGVVYECNSIMRNICFFLVHMYTFNFDRPDNAGSYRLHFNKRLSKSTLC